VGLNSGFAACCAETAPPFRTASQTEDLTRGEQNVNVVRHDDVAVKAVSTLVTVLNDFVFDDRGPIG
jgi:hypothetical protein